MFLTEAYAKGKLASDYVAKIRRQCELMTYIPGFDKMKVRRLENLIESYEDKLKLAKQELSDYRSKSKTEQEKIERLNKIDTILSTSIKIAVIILSIYVSFVAAAKLAPSIAAKAGNVAKNASNIVQNAKKISKVKKIIFKIGKFGAEQVASHANTVAKMSNAAKLAKGAIKSAKEIEHGSDTVKLGGYETEIIRCIRELEQLLAVLKRKKTMFEMELEKKEKGLR